MIVYLYLQKSGENTFCIYSTGISFSAILVNTEKSLDKRKLVFFINKIS